MSSFIDYSKFVPKDTTIAWEPMPWADPWVTMIKSLGATQCFEVQTSDTTVSIIAVYPDEVTFI